MDITVEIADLRHEAESMMTDKCVVTRAGVLSGPPALDPLTGRYPEIASVTIYTGICSMKIPGTLSTGVRQPTAGDVATVFSAILAIPWPSARLLVGDHVLFTASDFNPGLPGLRFTVAGLLPGSHITKQRVSVSIVVD